MKRLHEPIPKDFPVQPLKKGQKATAKAICGHCGLSWDDGKVTSMTPVPAARCPFEQFHIYSDPSSGKFKCWIRWGDSVTTQRDLYKTPRDAQEYCFSTQAELDAFLYALNEHDGWLGCDVFTEKKDLKAEPKTWDEV